MPINVTCPCGKRNEAKDEWAGKNMICPGCGELLAIPGIPHAVPVAVPPPKPPPVARVVPPRAPGTPPAPPRTPPPEPAREEAPLAPVASASGLFDALASPLKVGGFYASHMGGLWKLFQESMPLLHPARDHQREFRLE